MLLFEEVSQTPDEGFRQSPSIDPTRSYLREIGRVLLLTREQEIGFRKQVQQMTLLLEAKTALVKKLLHELALNEWASHVQMSEVELNDVVRRAQRAKQKMIEANLRLVVVITKNYQKLTKNYQKRSMEFLDLIQEGNMGLACDVEKFDPTKGYRFSNCAYWWIYRAISRAITEKSRRIRLASHITEKLNKIKKAPRHLSQQLGRTPTAPELAAKLRITHKQLEKYHEWA